MKTFGYKRTIDLNKFDCNSIAKERYTRGIKADKGLKKRNLSDEQIIDSVSKEMISAMDNWER